MGRGCAVLLAVLAVAAALPARADITVRDDGEQGLVFGNVEALPAPEAGRPDALAARSRRLRAERQKFAAIVRSAAQAHGLPEALLQALIEVESGFDAAAVSPRGAVGLMQLMPGTARDLGVHDARDPAANVEAGTRYLKRLLALYGNDLALALAAYNAGPAAVNRSGGLPRNPETQAYVPRVIARYHRLQSAAD
ncbi:transglycosylase SLT domain-containing protein [Ramlibacter sp. MAH-25]|uniref:Transglycosylase SLT domain-containing protein n=1 Tax=Ramlibacter pinisoli TaxID=2682844 RepID=A0A6N8IYY2_9BURK|nr:lytic transglycosylase domain-containing protein [Ramlibacter sp. CGMCC 1.13660]MVQ31795.1 transglycosylase SLT domain-containing protein [Ramlibacter pinisoli]